MYRPTTIALAALLAITLAADQTTYQKPPKAIQEVLDAPSIQMGTSGSTKRQECRVELTALVERDCAANGGTPRADCSVTASSRATTGSNQVPAPLAECRFYSES